MEQGDEARSSSLLQLSCYESVSNLLLNIHDSRGPTGDTENLYIIILQVIHRILEYQIIKIKRFFKYYTKYRHGSSF